ncbi:MAG: hypothetical protein ABIJ97_07695 [Bacteroidota bacterium]
MKGLAVQYITKLLYFHECVIIPEFGGFVTSSIPARIDWEKGFFSPPEKKILFNRNLVNNDGLLISTISGSENISYQDSKKLVADFVKELMIDLSREGFVFPSIGKFYYNSEKQICFEPALSRNLNTEVYGMSPFSFPAILKPGLVSVIDKKFKDRESVRQLITDKAAKRILIGVPLLLLLAFLPFKTNFDHNNRTDEAGLNYRTSDNYMKKFNKPLSVDEAIFQLTRKENALMYNEPPLGGINKDLNFFVDTLTINKEIAEIVPEKEEKIIETKSDESGVDLSAKYHLIAGSFTDNNRAEIFCKQLKSKGYNPIILPPDKGRLRISIASFIIKSDASHKLDSLRNNADLSLWMLTRN